MAEAKAKPRLRWRWLQLLGVVVALGIPMGVMWAFLSRRPGYVVSQDLGAGLSERGLADVFSADALFVCLAAVSGIIIGLLSWWRFQDRNWTVCAAAILGSFAASLVMWQLGLVIAPPTFDERLAAAQPGDVIPIDLSLHSLSALLVGPFCAITPVMLLAAFLPERMSTVQPQPEARRVAAVD